MYTRYMNTTEVKPLVERIVSPYFTDNHVDMTNVDVETLRAKPKGSFLEEYGISDNHGIMVNNGVHEKHYVDQGNIDQRRVARGDMPRLAVRPEEIPWHSTFAAMEAPGPIRKAMNFIFSL